MKVPVCPNRCGTASRAFTLTELLVTMSVFMLLMAGLMAAQLTGMKMRRIAETKLSATATGRHALNQIRNEIRTAKLLSVGTGNSASFVVAPDLTPQTGNALQICATTNKNNFVRYYLDASAQSLMRVTSADPTPEVVAPYVTNQIVFAAEDFRGNTLTNSQNNRVIRMVLELYKWEFPIATAGNGGLYDYFRLQTRMTRRAIE